MLQEVRSLSPVGVFFPHEAQNLDSGEQSVSPAPKVVECPVSPGEDPHVPAGTRVVRARAGMLEGGSLTDRFYQGPFPAPGCLQPSQLSHQRGVEAGNLL